MYALGRVESFLLLSSTKTPLRSVPSCFLLLGRIDDAGDLEVGSGLVGVVLVVDKPVVHRGGLDNDLHLVVFLELFWPEKGNERM